MQVTHVNCDTGRVEVRDATEQERAAMQANFDAKAAHDIAVETRRTKLASDIQALEKAQPGLAALLIPIIQSSGLQGLASEG